MGTSRSATPLDAAAAAAWASVPRTLSLARTSQRRLGGRGGRADGFSKDGGGAAGQKRAIQEVDAELVRQGERSRAREIGVFEEATPDTLGSPSRYSELGGDGDGGDNGSGRVGLRRLTTSL
ncbi:hypothetical protein GGS23DRAFT_599042 [Durotheca rogersii]|uniref:uncharacterized protein n=1 Tax=Durotheca rogersii TaxID=419775 RepID=UPI00221E950D|nr:uncharacterized protein GGS23DRAFT_599042 [Durotheca rogersii]KAI5860823.1 hypothetical protein GGS23DRAFT_599042 [Durotheca rogersii]